MPTVTAAGVIFVNDAPRVATFYQAVANMEVLHADAQHVVLEGAGFQLTVHALPMSCEAPATFATREDAYIKLCFPVTDIARARVAAQQAGGELWPAEREWQARGFRACDGRDPEGNVFQLRQPVT